MKGLFCRAGASDAEPKFVIQETVSLCFDFADSHPSGESCCWLKG